MPNLETKSLKKQTIKTVGQCEIWSMLTRTRCFTGFFTTNFEQKQTLNRIFDFKINSICHKVVPDLTVSVWIEKILYLTHVDTDVAITLTHLQLSRDCKGS